jgi:hypothetical protein
MNKYFLLLALCILKPAFADENLANANEALKMHEQLTGTVVLDVKPSKCDPKDATCLKSEAVEQKKDVEEHLKGKALVATPPSKCDPKDESCLKKEAAEQKKLIEDQLLGKKH